MIRELIPALGAPLAALVCTIPVNAGNPGYVGGSNAFDVGRFSPSTYGYNLDAVSTGYYGGGSYREYYSYGRGYGIANFPGPLVGPGLPPDYRGPRNRWTAQGIAPGPEVMAPAAAEPVCYLFVHVPAADAEIWLEGAKTAQTGPVRWFISPKLTPGQEYEYKVKAKWKTDGKDVEQLRTVTIKAGDRLTVVFPAEEKAADAANGPALFPLGH